MELKPLDLSISDELKSVFDISPGSDPDSPKFIRQKLAESALTAAENGDFQDLGRCLQSYFEMHSSRIGNHDEFTKIASTSRCSEANMDTPVIQQTYDNVINDFFTSANNDSILHLVLERPKLSTEDEKERQIDTDLNYMRCANILFDRLPKKVLLFLVNQQDTAGNTPLHYAVNSWPKTTVQKLLELGANIAIKNVRGEMPMFYEIYSQTPKFGVC